MNQAAIIAHNWQTAFSYYIFGTEIVNLEIRVTKPPPLQLTIYSNAKNCFYNCSFFTVISPVAYFSFGN
jgi:hypothetical protein